LTLGTQIAAALVVGSLATKMRRLADTDSLTGLENRRALERALAWQLARSRRTPAASVWISVLDLDGFKAFNDRHGHSPATSC
jgi:diguanylate cyclase (GGDEF)-like protein